MHYSSGPRVILHPLPEVNFLMVEIPTPKPYIFIIRVNRQIKCPNNLLFVLWNLMISWIVFILDRKIFPIHHTYIYSLVSYLFIKQDQMILTCNSAVASLMLSRFFLKKLEKNLLWYAVNKVINIKTIQDIIKFQRTKNKLLGHILLVRVICEKYRLRRGKYTKSL
jgi:hypothetical protein